MERQRTFVDDPLSVRATLGRMKEIPYTARPSVNLHVFEQGRRREVISARLTIITSGESLLVAYRDGDNKPRRAEVKVGHNPPKEGEILALEVLL